MKMLRKTYVASAAVLLIAGATLAVPASAQATDEGASSTGASGLRLRVAPLPGYTGTPRGAYLDCAEPGGDPRHAGRACDQLAAADGYVERVPAQRGPCYLIYSPVRATASGFWHGEPRSYSKVFPNRCVAIRQTGGVLFDF